MSPFFQILPCIEVAKMFAFSSFSGYSASSSLWSVSLLQFQIAGEIPAELFILTRCYDNERVSELYYFLPIAKRLFFQWVHQYHKETGLDYTLKGVAL